MPLITNTLTPAGGGDHPHFAHHHHDDPEPDGVKIKACYDGKKYGNGHHDQGHRVHEKAAYKIDQHQHGALAALDMDQRIVEQRRAALEHRRDLSMELASPLFPCARPAGAFYLFADVTAWLKPHETAGDLCMRLLEQAGVALVPGEAFFGPGHVRISFGAPEENLIIGFKKIGEAL
jgi:DNA-binding transcriptional MocR family regulator